MVFSINKLEKLLASKGFLIRKFFIIHGLCAYIEVMSINTADIFMLSIPSRYKFNMETGNNVYKIRYIDMGDECTRDTSDEYAGSPDNIDLEKAYSEIETNISPDNYDDEDDENVASRLEEAYKRPISLKDISKEDTKHVRDIFRQLKRLKYCVQSIRYKLVIVWNTYLCVLNRDDSIECFYIKKFPVISSRKLLVACDLELFYEKLETIEHDITQVKYGIYKILDKNQDKHTRNINRMLEERNDVIKYSNDVQVKKSDFQRHIINFETLLSKTIDSEKILLEKLYNMNDRTESGLQGVHSDTSVFHQKGKIEKELSSLNKTKQEIIKNILTLKTKMEDMVLTTDKIMFDNSVMFDQILRNFIKLADVAN